MKLGERRVKKRFAIVLSYTIFFNVSKAIASIAVNIETHTNQTTKKEKIMISESTRAVIETTIKHDDGMTEAERSKIRLLLAGKQDNKMITSKQACEMLECSRRTLHNWEMAGKINAVRHSKRHVRYNLAEVEALMVNGMA